MVCLTGSGGRFFSSAGFSSGQSPGSLGDRGPPPAGALSNNRLVARREGNNIVQEERDDNGGIIRWVFTDIEKNSARWYGERSMDGDKTWKLEVEFFLIRER